VHAKSVSRRYSSNGIPMSRLPGVILASSRARLRCSARAQLNFTKRSMGTAMRTAMMRTERRFDRERQHRHLGPIPADRRGQRPHLTTDGQPAWSIVCPPSQPKTLQPRTRTSNRVNRFRSDLIRAPAGGSACGIRRRPVGPRLRRALLKTDRLEDRPLVDSANDITTSSSSSACPTDQHHLQDPEGGLGRPRWVTEAPCCWLGSCRASQ
jgi:hypothetical protein